jgi:hypothetical protein
MDLLKELKNITKLLKGEKDIEVEFRLGQFINRRFNPNLEKEYFKKIFNSIKDFDKINYSSVIKMDNNIRGVYNRKVKKMDVENSINFLRSNMMENYIMKYNYERKTTIQKITSGHLRLSISREEPMKSYNNRSRTNYYVDRIRFEKLLGDNLRLDMSINYVNYEIEFQIELEILDIKKIKYTSLKKYLEKIGTDSFKINGIRYLQPNTLERKDLNILTGRKYSVTDKADGKRGVLILNKHQSLMINPRNNTIIKKFPNIISKKLTVIDGEYIEKTDRYFAFDLLFSNGVDFRGEYLDKRYTELLKYKDLKMNIDFSVKKFYFDNIFKKAKEIWTNKDKYDYNLDGLIFTPVEQYYNPDNLHQPIYKWKEFHSVDIRIEYNRREDFTYFHAAGGKNPWNRDPNINFNRVFMFNFEFDKYNLGKTVRNKYFLGHQGEPPKGYKVKDDIVEVEFDSNKNKWVYLRTRTDDKKNPNYFRTVQSVVNAIVFNIDINTLSMLDSSSETNEIGNLYDFTKDSTVRRKEWRLMNNQYKRSLLQQTAKLVKGDKKVLVDLGSGKLGDLFKWIKSGITDILAIDTSYVELFGDNGAEQRLLNNDFNYNGSYYTNGLQKIYLAWGDVSKKLEEIGYREEDKKVINDFIKEYKKADIVSSMYAIHYFFADYKDGEWKKTDKNVKNLQYTIEKLLKKDGYLIGIFLNGDKIKKSLRFKNEEGDLFYGIRLKNKDDFETLLIKNVVWGNVEIEEPKINFDMIKKYFPYKEIDVKIDEGNIKLTKDERRLIDINYPFILQK